MKKTVPPERGTSREAAGGGLTYTETPTKELAREQYVAARDKLLPCMENPSGLRATSPTRRRSFPSDALPNKEWIFLHESPQNDQTLAGQCLILT